MANSGRNEGQTNKNIKDSRFDLEISDEDYEKITEALSVLQRLTVNRPLAAQRLAIKMGKAVRIAEGVAAHQAHNRFRVSWARISEEMGHQARWAFDRYREDQNFITHKVGAGPRKRLKVSRVFTEVMDNRDLSEEPKPEVEE